MPRTDRIVLTDKQTHLLFARATAPDEVKRSMERVLDYAFDGRVTVIFKDHTELDLTVLASEIEEFCDRAGWGNRRLRQTKYSLRKKLKILDAWLKRSAVDRLADLAPKGKQ